LPLDESKVIKIADLDGYSLATVYWTEDGQSVVYALQRLVWPRYELEMQWYKYETASGTACPTGPHYTSDRQILERLHAERPGWISPSGKRVIYARVSPDEPYTPTPQGLDLPPIEIWTAKPDGTDAFRLYGPHPGCRNLGPTIWSAQETEVFFHCGYEGSDLLVMVTVDRKPVVHYSILAAAGFGWAALSPDRTRLAFTDINGILRVDAVNSSEDQILGLGRMPNWSSDSRSLYYLKVEQETYSLVGIFVADLESGMDAALFDWSGYFPDKEPTIGYFAVSPTGNKVVLELEDLWLLMWSP